MASAARARMVARFNQRQKGKPPGPPTWPRNPRQDTFGNPTTKKPGDVGTAVGRHGKWRDMAGARRARSSKDWR